MKPWPARAPGVLALVLALMPEVDPAAWQPVLPEVGPSAWQPALPGPHLSATSAGAPSSWPPLSAARPQVPVVPGVAALAAGASGDLLSPRSGPLDEPDKRSSWREHTTTALSMARVLRDARLATPDAATSQPHTNGSLRPRTAEAAPSHARWEWPLAGRPAVVHAFDPPAQRWLPGHRGIDLAGVTGEPVRAVAAGVVSYSGVIAGVGVVSVLHPDGVLSTYQPVLDRAARGATVSAGDAVGTLGPGGHCLLSSCLHLGARRGTTYLDPMLFLTAWQVSLLPTS